MKASILATNPSARCWLKWLSEQINNQKVTECLKGRVKTIITEKSEGGICVRLQVNGEYARKILEMKGTAILSALQAGYAEQAGVKCTGFSAFV
jgi:shikimate kinase